jgi:predicted permease
MRTRSLSDVAAWDKVEPSFDDLGRQENSLLVTCNYFRVLGMNRTIMGRFFLADECQLGTEARVVVLSEHFWRNLYASDPHIVGKVIYINRRSFVVIGVAADNDANLIFGGAWLPYTLQPVFNHDNDAFKNPNSPWLTVVARLRRGYTRADAQAEIATILRQRDRFYLEQRAFTLDRKTSIVLTDGSYIESPALQTLAAGLVALVMGPLLLVLLLACTNVTTLFLSRSIVRRGEIAVRLSLGAGRGRLTRMLLVESLLIALIAGVASIWLAARIPSLVISSLDPDDQFASSIHPDWKVFGFLAALVLTAAVVSALTPARESFRFDLVSALKGREGSVTSRTKTTSALIVVQLAMSFVLVAAAVMFARMPSTIEGIDPGFETRHLMRVPLEISVPPYTKASAGAFYRTLEAKILGIPGVQSLAYASVAPFGFTQENEVRLDGQGKGQGRAASIDNVSLDFFSTFSIPLLHGRSFQKSDISASGTSHVAVVSQRFARAYWGAVDPVGKVVVTPGGERYVIIGLAADTRSERFGVVDGPRLYTLQAPDSADGELFVRFTGDAVPIANAIGTAVRILDRTQVEAPSTIWEFLQTNAAQIGALARIVIFMSGIAVALAITGVYAVLSFVINRRTREFGIQMMLGATRESIFGSVITRGLKQIAIGLLCGIVLSIPATLTFARMTKESPLPIHAFDIPMYCISAVVLLVVSICAMAVPALRATRVDPMQALRTE